ncbi:7 alpha-cephem-methoxylase [Penicillium chermesinum]|uniref:7 alpha-cephem-methoxylase n=1 Tax=Penicillium chermesinum TaxID=63820 RepID=A0A9W9TXK7_9EURO|nr:7 alpha-cephem-methoxylase [Penicillium chermesinum]KAJ5247027.1 7 alpha-cephem-methoxylase [Penicillium chermesinum]KAJ6145276.1 7 alpha-cephem-methoxylase [Penicillium chermesinum]
MMSNMARDEVASLRYLQWEEKFHDTKPYTLYMDVPDGFPPQNFKVDAEEAETIHDVRGYESKYSLDDNGFAYYKHHFELENHDRETLERDYIPQVEAFLMKTIPNATEVKIYTWRLRSSDSAVRNKLPGGVVNLSDPTHHLAPATAVHVVADGSTLDPNDLIAADYVRTTYQGENLLPLYNKNCRWYYMSDQMPDDVLLFKSYDSRAQSKAKCCPHVSFRPTKVPDVPKPRESIEVKAIVFSSE